MTNVHRFAPSFGGGEEIQAISYPPGFAINCNSEIPSLSVSWTMLESPAPSMGFTINCISDLHQKVADLTAASMADATRRAYRADLDHFVAWGGELPSTPELVVGYLVDQADRLSIATLTRRLAALSKTHAAKGWPNPCRSERVRVVMRGIKRRYGRPQQQAKALTRDDLFQVLGQMGDRLKDHRDRALLLIGFAGAFRRSELVGIHLADIERVPQGIVITLNRSKTDQDGRGRKVAIPFGRTRHCPVKALDIWLTEAGIADGPIFRPVTRHDHLGAGALTPEAVSLVLRDRLDAAGYDPQGFSGHSLRAGLATSAAQAGVPTHRIRAQTGHASDAMLARYIREGEMFTGNAAAAVL